MLNSEPIVSISRGPLLECLHRGHIVVVNASGQTLYQLGNPSYKTFARSTAKLFQVLPLIETGAADYFDFTAEEIAIMCSSHNGEPRHVATVRAILAKLGLEDTALLCGVHEPYHRETREAMRVRNETPNVLQNNCSGKHVGMLALARYTNSSLTAYNMPDHPVQQLMLKTLCELAQVRQDEIELGIDGCGVPVYGLNIDQLALAFARFGSDKLTPVKRAAACQRIMSAIKEHPFNLAGSDRLDTELIKVTDGRLIGKMGAEGVYGVIVPSTSWGIVVKVEDGSARALHPTVIEVLKQLQLLSESELEQLADFHMPDIKNRRDETVGKISPTFALKSVQT